MKDDGKLKKIEWETDISTGLLLHHYLLIHTFGMHIFFSLLRHRKAFTEKNHFLHYVIVSTTHHHDSSISIIPANSKASQELQAQSSKTSAKTPFTMFASRIVVDHHCQMPASLSQRLQENVVIIT